MKDGGSAFPIIEPQGFCSVSEGMTLRDYFAGQALAGMIQNDYQEAGEKWAEFMAADAYKIARAMIKEREKNEPPMP